MISPSISSSCIGLMQTSPISSLWLCGPALAGYGPVRFVRLFIQHAFDSPTVCIYLYVFSSIIQKFTMEECVFVWFFISVPFNALQLYIHLYDFSVKIQRRAYQASAFTIVADIGSERCPINACCPFSCSGCTLKDMSVFVQRVWCDTAFCNHCIILRLGTGYRWIDQLSGDHGHSLDQAVERGSVRLRTYGFARCMKA